MLSTVAVPRPVHFSQPETSLGRTDLVDVGDRFRDTREVCPHSFETEGAHDGRTEGRSYIPNDAEQCLCRSFAAAQMVVGRGEPSSKSSLQKKTKRGRLIELLRIVQGPRVNEKRHGLLVLKFGASWLEALGGRALGGRGDALREYRWGKGARKQERQEQSKHEAVGW
jgi:hypothetical protein